MITVGLIKEFYYISTVLKTPVVAAVRINGMKAPLDIKISSGCLDLWYRDLHIWRETIEGTTSFFGVESCDAISRIIVSLEAGDPNWSNYRYIEKS